MTETLLQLGLFAAKSIIVLTVIIAVLLIFFMLLAKSRHKISGQLTIKNLNKKFMENTEMIMQEILPKKDFKKFVKAQKAEQKKREENSADIKNIYVLNFNGDMHASAVGALTEEVNAVLNAAKPKDEILVKIESGGGVVHGYGLGAAQLMRIRNRNIPLTIAIDKVAASGGYLMACTANKILAAPFAYVGSIGVVVQLPNFNRKLKDNHIDYEMHTAGEYKRTITMFGENTDEGRAKLHEEINAVHDQFKDLIKQHRPQMNLADTATGEYWLAQRALQLQLVDEIKTSDEYLLSHANTATIFEITFEEHKPLLQRLTSAVSMKIVKLLQSAF